MRITAQTYNTRDKTTTLFFHASGDETYFVKGAVCWPELVDLFGVRDFRGFAMVGGLDVNTGIVHIWDEAVFVSIDTIVEPDGRVADGNKGLGPWLNLMWSRYFVTDFYYSQDKDEHRKYLLDILRSPTILPKPRFINVRWEDTTASQHIIWKYARTGKLKATRDTELHKQVQLVDRGAKKTLPAVHALQCLLEGFERFPYRKSLRREDL